MTSMSLSLILNEMVEAKVSDCWCFGESCFTLRIKYQSAIRPMYSGKGGFNPLDTGVAVR